MSLYVLLAIFLCKTTIYFVNCQISGQVFLLFNICLPENALVRGLKTPRAGIGNAARGNAHRRSRGLPSPQAAFVTTA